MTDYEYLDWWRTARKAREWYKENQGRPDDIRLFSYNFGLFRGGMQTTSEVIRHDDSGMEATCRRVIEMFLDEFNRRHDECMTVDEFLK